MLVLVWIFKAFDEKFDHIYNFDSSKDSCLWHRLMYAACQQQYNKTYNADGWTVSALELDVKKNPMMGCIFLTGRYKIWILVGCMYSV